MLRAKAFSMAHSASASWKISRAVDRMGTDILSRFGRAGKVERRLSPFADGCLHLREMTFKEMVGVRHDHQMFRDVGRIHDRAQHIFRTVLVPRPADKEFGLGALREKFEAISPSVGGYRSAQRDRGHHPRVRAVGAQPRGGSE